MQVTADNESRYRKGFKVLNHFMLGIWRLGLGKYLNAWPEVSGRIMVLNHIGRKTGKRRQTPVNYAMVNGEIYCTAGFGASSDWYLNIIANPQVEVWLPDGWWAGIADEVIDPKLRLPLMREVIIASGAAAPAFGIKVQDLDDAALDELTRDYKLLRIRRTTARTGPGGPGDFAWIWPLTTLFLLLFLIFRRRN
mgnify:CR=1 FL=1